MYYLSTDFSGGAGDDYAHGLLTASRGAIRSLRLSNVREVSLSLAYSSVVLRSYLDLLARAPVLREAGEQLPHKLYFPADQRLRPS